MAAIVIGVLNALAVTGLYSPETLRLIAILPKPTATPPPTKIPEREGRETSTPQAQAINTPCSPNDPNYP